MHITEEDDMIRRFVRAPDGAVYLFNGETLRPANDPTYRDVMKWYGAQGSPWDQWSQEQIDAVPKVEGN
jgi:hypothetical protein